MMLHSLVYLLHPTFSDLMNSSGTVELVREVLAGTFPATRYPGRILKHSYVVIVGNLGSNDL